MLCTVLGLGRYLDKDGKTEKCALYVAYSRKDVIGQATRALILNSDEVDKSIQPDDVIDIVIDFNGNIESINIA